MGQYPSLASIIHLELSSAFFICLWHLDLSNFLLISGNGLPEIGYWDGCVATNERLAESLKITLKNTYNAGEEQVGSTHFSGFFPSVG